MESVTFEVDNARNLQALFANDEKLLRELEEVCGVRFTTRDAWLKIEGDAPGVGMARNFFEQLEAARRAGLRIGRPEFAFGLNALRDGREPRMSELMESRIVCSRHKPPVIARTQGQKQYVEAIRKHDITFGLGPAGTGKTYLAVALAVEALKQEKVRRIVLTRPAVEAGEALGFLPGDLTEKILPYLRPLYDALADMLDAEETQKFMDRGIIEIAPLAYMRGRTLSSSFVILDEAQNTTTEQMFMFLTRLGADSKCVVTGDATQIDLPRNKRSGLLEAIDALHGIDGLAFHTFEESDVVRHPLVQRIIRAYRQHRHLDDETSTSLPERTHV
jgi:phosphate starvation-inducible protein PhoH and related proteins